MIVAKQKSIFEHVRVAPKQQIIFCSFTLTRRQSGFRCKSLKIFLPQHLCKMCFSFSVFFLSSVVYIGQIVLRDYYYPKINLLQNLNLSFVAFELGFLRLTSRASQVRRPEKTCHEMFQDVLSVIHKRLIKTRANHCKYTVRYPESLIQN